MMVMNVIGVHMIRYMNYHVIAAVEMDREKERKRKKNVFLITFQLIAYRVLVRAMNEWFNCICAARKLKLNNNNDW